MTDQSGVIYQKLEDFIKKFYTNELLRGSLFFTGLGLLYFLFTLFIEYFLWLKPTARTLLFILFVGVELFLLMRYIFFPLFKLFKLQKGIDYNQASQIIGSHFNEVGDKLTNFLQLSRDASKSELLVASIQQKAANLQPIPFTKAINFYANKKYIPLAVIPVLLLLFFMLSGKSEVLSQSFNRVMNYREQFTPPAPFGFVITNSNLQTEQNKDFLLQVKTQGKVVPENVMIFMGDESYYMESTGPGSFQFVIPKPKMNLDFHLEANAVTSGDYTLEVVTVPSIANFEMVMRFPSYLNKKTEIVKGTGNAIVPEGTKITWRMQTLATQKVLWTSGTQFTPFAKSENTFILAKSISQNTDYQIRTSNEKIKNYEKLNYHIAVITDQYPTISVGNAPDSLKVDKGYLLGQVGDDHGLSKLQVVYYPKNNSQEAKRGLIPVKRDVYDRFIYAFPGDLPIQAGIPYEYYFEVFDNDVLHHYKSTKSMVFSHRESTESEKEDQLLQQQNQNINSLEKSLKTQEKQFNEMDKLQKMSKEKEQLEFKEQQKVNDFIQRQKNQDAMMKEFSEKMKDNLDKMKSDKKDETKELLKERLEKLDKDFEKNKKLLEELQKLNEKIQKEALFEKMDQLKQQSKNQTKNLQQLVELTKKYYVEKKAEQLADKLDKLSEKQDKLAENDKENSANKQEEVNKEFDAIQKEMDELQKENNELKSPLELPNTESTEKNIEKDLQQAKDQLEKNSKSGAKPKQKSAAQKMKQMSLDMGASMEAGEMEQMDEDIEMLRQIIDNLVAYSFSQEEVLKNFKGMKRGAPSFNKYLKAQQDLKLQFKHVDDSLFAMSLRNPKIAEDITKEVGNAQYNIDKAIDNLADANVSKGTSHQQFAVSSANKLADLLASILNGMQMSMSMAGAGKGKPKPGQGQGMQLPDIIQKQEGLAEKMKKGMKKGQQPGEGKEGNKGQKPGGKEGQGQSGNNPNSNNGQGNQGQAGKKGGSGSGNNEGEDGQEGEGNARAIMDIYKEQQQLREALEKELNKQGLGGQGQNALNQMKTIEKQLINKGFDNEVLQRALNLKYEMLKLQKAIQQQGEEKKRQSETNKKDFRNTANPIPLRLQEYLNSIEILNRQTLPLRPVYNRKVQEYLKSND
ncbi:DUF4175 family protein [Flavobacterium sp.]|uniref:DUF4175 family protein n=1 Tax=Flavobacterium sp. TaxID=239 RepID=UPI00263624F0|nr:DUF4175 family protein [Flavobacterium sp.]